MDLQNIAFLLLGLIVLIVGGEFLVRGASKIAESLHISPLVVGLTVVAFGTSAPELFISVKAALSGSTEIAMGNVIGSNICNLALVLGVTAIIYPIVVRESSIKEDWIMTMGSSLLLYFFIAQDHVVQNFEGFVLFTIVVGYTYFLIDKARKSAKAKKEEELEAANGEELPSLSQIEIIKELAFIIAGGFGLYFGAEWFVEGAKNIAFHFEVNETLVGLTVVALGTSLPELVASSIAALKKETDLAIGNLLGSCIFNVLSILGITSMIKSIPVPADILNRDIFFMLGITLIVLPMMISKRRIGRVEGFILLGLYGGYIYYLAQHI